MGGELIRVGVNGMRNEVTGKEETNIGDKVPVGWLVLKRSQY